MKTNYYKFLFIAGTFFIGLHTFSQTATNPTTNAIMLASKIADRMRDSLQLTTTQRDQINNLNLQISNQKQTLRSQIINRDSLTIAMQKIENSRDSSYRPILTTNQFNTYRQKKRFLITGN